eukprot:PITA_05915
MPGLPSTKHGNDCVFVVIDRFSKMAIMTTCKKSITAEATAKLFFERVWVHFGIPQPIISDQDNRFLRTFWSSLWSMSDTKLTKSTTFHPQINGQTESEADKANNFIKNIKQICQQVHDILEKSNAKYKQLQDQHRVPHKFQVDDKVWLHLQKDRLARPHRKIRPIRYGSYTITKAVGDNDFELNIPPFLGLHPVFNVDRFWPYFPPLLDTSDITKQLTPTEFNPDCMEQDATDRIMDTQIKNNHQQKIQLYRVVKAGQLLHQGKWLTRDKVQ